MIRLVSIKVRSEPAGVYRAALAGAAGPIPFPDFPSLIRRRFRKRRTPTTSIACETPTASARYDRLRAFIQHAFLKRNLEALGEPMRAMARESATELTGRDRFDFIEDFS